MKPESKIRRSSRCLACLVRRSAFICKYCDGVYADEPVTSCDCLGHYDKNPPHFIKGEIKYRLPKETSPSVGATETDHE